MNISIADLEFEPMIDSDTIAERVKSIALQITADYAGKAPLFIGVLNGSFIFMAELLKQVDLPCQLSFIKVSSYHGGLESTKEITIELDLKLDIAERDVVIVEDIVDTGYTINYLLNRFKASKPTSISVCSLLLKPTALEQPIRELKYIGFEIENKFVVGYGLDYQEFGRNLNGIYQLVG